MSSSPRAGGRGFGYLEERSRGYRFDVKHHSDGGVTISERTAMDERGKLLQPPREKAKLTAFRWHRVRDAVAAEFNQRLRQDGLRAGRWLKDTTPLAPHFGKELVLLAWAIDDQDVLVIPRMLANWRGLAPEERWWFYTTINASTRRYPNDINHGWKAAIKIAFLDEPRDIGLESLRVASEPVEHVNPTRIGKRDQSDISDGPMQGRLFAEPDAAEYDLNPPSGTA